MKSRQKFNLNFDQFTKECKALIVKNISEKGFSWRIMDTGQLQDLLDQYIRAENWESVANLAFMLWETTDLISRAQNQPKEKGVC